jgi:5S rRNA maturation endonuclease (ribonuclease M5)
MVTRRERQQEALDELKALLKEEKEMVLVEGIRDVEALRYLDPNVSIEVCSHVGKTEHDIAVALSKKTRRVLVLTDFDEKGITLAKRLSLLLEAEGVHVDREFRRKFGRLMGVLRANTVETLDDVAEDIGKVGA